MFHEALPLFADRRDAGERLASALARRRGGADLAGEGDVEWQAEVAGHLGGHDHAPAGDAEDETGGIRWHRGAGPQLVGQRPSGVDAVGEH